MLLPRSVPILLISLLAALGCRPAAPSREAARSPAGRPDSTAAPTITLLPAPPDSAIPASDLGDAIRRGRALVLATAESLPGHVATAPRLRCVSCHLDEGRRANGSPWVGVSARFPQYSGRAARVITLEDRINGCFRRSMNGKPLAVDSADMRDIVAFFTFLSRGVRVGDTVPGQGLPKLPVTQGDSAAGHRLFAATCVRCHGPDGHGTGVAPPLWGPGSFNIGAGMARVRTAAAFIRYNMPFDRPGTLTDQQAFDIASYVTAQPRPDLPGKENDWPRGNPPPDAAYHTTAAPAGRQ